VRDRRPIEYDVASLIKEQRAMTELYIASASVWLPVTHDRAEDALARGDYDRDDLAATGYESAGTAGDIAPPDMASHAAKQAIAHSGYDPEDLVLVAHASAWYQGHPFWSAASYVQRQVGATNAMAVNVNQMCNGGAAAMDITLGYLAGRSCDDAALVTTADRFSLPGFDRWRSDYGIVYGDGGTAVVLSRRAGPLRVKAWSTVTEPELESMHRGTDPFTASPTTPDGPLSIRRTKKAYLQSHGKDSKDMVGAIQERGARRALDTALCHASCDPADAKILILPNLGRKILQSLYWPLFGVTNGERTLWHIGSRTGHLGAGDVSLGLATVLDKNLLQPGELAIVLGAGAGYSWTCLIVERISDNG